MNTQDWISLFVSVVLNGIFLWGVQYIIMHNVEKRSRFDQIKSEVYRNNLLLIENGIATCRELMSVIANCDEHNKIAEMDKVVSQLRDDFRKLLYFYQDYHLVIDEDKHCKEMYQNLNTRFLEAMENWTNPENGILLQFLKDSEPLLRSIMDATLKHIYMIK